jgi:hypothetical protein
VEKAIESVIVEFQSDSNRYWNERDIHWSLFHYLKNQGIFQRKTELIRAEFPTRVKYLERKNKARGHYDVVVLNPEILESSKMKEMPPWAEWEEYLPQIEISVAIEVKAWTDRLKNYEELINWDLDKLTNVENAVECAYFLNFVQLDFSKSIMNNYYHTLRNCLMEKHEISSRVKILCVPHLKILAPNPASNWII